MTTNEIFYLAAALVLISFGILAICAGIILISDKITSNKDRNKSWITADQINRLELTNEMFRKQIGVINTKFEKMLLGQAPPENVLFILYSELKKEMDKKFEYLDELIREARD